VCKNNSELYDSWEKDVQVEELYLDDAEIVLTAYGISGRIARSAVTLLRREGIKAGLIRPRTVSPFPYESYEKLDFGRVRTILDIEMSIPAQMVNDVRLAVRERCPIETCLHAGGEIMGRDEVMARARELAK
jgi:2-oxoglutarate ferredoxin oxidoreductase subunit alpha